MCGEKNGKEKLTTSRHLLDYDDWTQMAYTTLVTFSASSFRP